MLRRQSTSSPAVSTPEKPPPMTTKWPSRRRTAGSVSSSICATRRSTMLRMCIASPIGLQRQRVLGESGDQIESRAIAERQHQMLVSEA